MSKIIAEEWLQAEMADADEAKPGNPIHSTAGAQQYGFRAALVGGATVYGWAVRTIVGVLGERWLGDGWAHVRFRQPVYPNDTLQVRVDDAHEFSILNAQEVAVGGELGLGRAPWLDDLAMPTALAAVQHPAARPRLTPDNVPVGRDLAASAVALSVAAAIEFARDQERETLPQFFGPAPLAHPAWLAAQPIHLLHHSYDYGPAIHVESHIQHLGRAVAGQTFLVAGRCVAAYARKGHQYMVNDCVIRAEGGADVARIRHTVIYQVAKRGQPTGGA